MDETKIAELLTLFDECFPYLESGRGSIPHLAEHNVVHRCVIDEKLAGAAIVGGGNIYFLAVAPQYRRRGIGAHLLAESEKTCADAGYDRVTVGVGKDGYITLTPAGREIAEKIYERHTFFSNFLMRLGVDEETAAADACKIEHDISAKSFEALKKYAEENFK